MRRSEIPGGEAEEEVWTPQISLGTSVLIPEGYVADLSVRLGLYRRLSAHWPEEIEAFAAELIDRFGPLPQEVENLLEIIAVKQLCRIAGVEQIDAGPKGAVLVFRNNTPPKSGTPNRLYPKAHTFDQAAARPENRLSARLVVFGCPRKGSASPHKRSCRLIDT